MPNNPSSNISIRPPLDQIVSRLGKYFGVISKSAFLSHAAKGLVTDPSAFTLETGVTSLGNVILSMQEGGKMTCDLIKEINETYKSAETGTELEELSKYLRITYEHSDMEDSINCIAVHGHKNGAKKSDQGTKIPDTDPVYSIRNVLSTLREASVINSNPSDPNRYSAPGLSVIQMFPTTLTPANRDTGAIGILLNAISTLEISRAVPFIDIVAISNSPMLTDEGRISQLSLGQFLMGNVKVESSGERELVSAIDTAVSSGPPRPKGDTSADDVQRFSTAGMELFTSPQTLVNGNEIYQEFDTIGSQNLVGRAAPVIDRFRPLMSISELKVSVAPTVGTMSYKTADLTLILHDRSRLAEISAFVKPDAFNRNHFIIEYGWAHPDNKVHEFKPLGGSTGSVLDDNVDASLVGLFISHMRCKEKYTVVNSSFNFDDAGQVTVNVKLAMMGGEDNYLVAIGDGGEVESQVKVVKDLMESISIFRKKIGGDIKDIVGSEDVLGDGNILNIASSAETDTAISQADAKKIRDFIRNNTPPKGGTKGVEETQKLADLLKKLLGEKGDGKDSKSAAGKLKKSIQDEIKRKMEAVKNNYDPWLRTDFNFGDTSITEKNVNEYVSLGKLFTIFLGMPLADSKKFDDVQLYFYGFNDKASFAKDMNIAHFPIKKDDFDKMLSNELKLEANLPIGKFITFFNKAFIADQGSIAYGMSSIFAARDPENLMKRKLAKKFEADGTAVFGEKQRILRAAYGEGANLNFKLPALKIKIETVPSAPRGIGAAQETGAEKTILRIQIFDSQASSYTCLSSLLTASRRDQMGVVTKALGNITNNKNDTSPDHEKQFDAIIEDAVKYGLLELVQQTKGKVEIGDQGPLNTIPVEEASKRNFYRIAGGFPALKNFISRTMPSISYGAQGSGIVKATVQSMQNPLLATANMQRQGLRPGEEPQSKRDAGVPMTVQPVECSVETIGCPIWEFGQQIFFDFGTGTSVDNIYQVTGLDHSIKAGEFRTTVKLTSNLAWGIYESMIDKVMEAHAVVASRAEGRKPK